MVDRIRESDVPLDATPPPKDGVSVKIKSLTADTRGQWQLVSVDDLTHAEEVLDALDARGVTDMELLVMGNSSFKVRWREGGTSAVA